MLEWLKENQEWVSWLGGISVATIIASIIIVPILVTRMAPDYFLEDRKEKNEMKTRHPALRWIGLIFKNTIGAILVIGGILLSLPLVPGQGLLTIFIGLMVMDFPGKDRLELKLVRFRPVKRAIDWMRKRADKEPLLLPADTH